MFKKLSEAIRRKPIIGWGILGAVMVCVFLLGLLAASVTERRAEIATLYNNVKVKITGIEPRNEIWGENFPREYDTWKKTAEPTSEANIWVMHPRTYWRSGPRWWYFGRVTLSRAITPHHGAMPTPSRTCVRPCAPAHPMRTPPTCSPEPAGRARVPTFPV